MSATVSPRRLELAMSTAQQLLAELPEDDQLRLDTIEGETEAFELMDRITESVLADESLAELARSRAKRLEERADHRRAIILQMLEALEMTKVQRPLYTASLSHRSKPVVTNADELPRDFIREAVDLVALGKALRAGQTVEGAEMSNPMPSLTLRTR
jgi:Siphovirus Gp157.